MPGPQIANPTPAWLRPENASVFDPWYVTAARSLAQLAGLTSPQQAVLGMAAPTIPEGTELGGLAGLAQRTIRAFHGSPHDFERFDLSKIGTGEGAQAYGHGLYFAEDPAVAQSYRDQLASVTNAPSYPALKQAMDDAANAGIAAMQNPTRETQAAARAAQARVKALQDAVVAEPKGRMYEVAIKADPTQFLDWDKPLSEQSPEVQAGVQRAYRQWFGRDIPMEMRGADIVRSFGGGRSMAGMQEGGTALEQAIPGVKYLDAGSRGAGEGSRNYVVFDDSLIDILKKYGVAGAAIDGLRRLSQGQNGQLTHDQLQQAFTQQQ